MNPLPKWRQIFLLLALLALVVDRPAAAQRSTLLVGVFDNYPFAYQDITGEWIGFDFDFFEAIADKADLTFAYESTDFAQLIPNLATRYYDIAIGCIVSTPDRRTLVNFTDPYFVYQFILVVPEFSSIQGVADLTFDRTVSVLRGGIPERLARTMTTAQLLPIESFTLGLEAVIRGDAQASIVSDVVFTEYQRTHPAAKLKIIGEPLAYFECGAAVNKSDLLLLARLNETMATLREDGAFAQLYQRWFGDRPIMLTAPESAATAPITQTVTPTTPTALTPTAAMPTPNDGEVVGATIYYITHQTEPIAYEIITLLPNGVWMSTRHVATGTEGTPLSPTSVYGAWMGANNGIRATVLELSPASTTGAVSRYDYQMAVDAAGLVTGDYQVSAYAGDATSDLATTPSPTITISFTGQRLSIFDEQ